jgi:hypothetical protein
MGMAREAEVTVFSTEASIMKKNDASLLRVR